MPERIQRKRTKKGWKMPANTVSVTRPGPYGNPFKVGRDGTAWDCVQRYRAAWSLAVARGYPYAPFDRPIFLGPLVGKNLACFCALDQPCHADVLIELTALLAKDGRDA